MRSALRAPVFVSWLAIMMAVAGCDRQGGSPGTPATPLSPSVTPPPAGSPGSSEANLAGAVADSDGVALAGVQVTGYVVSGGRTTSTWGPTRTDAAGGFRFDDRSLRPLEYVVVVASLTGYVAPQERAVFRSDAGGALRSEVTIRMQPALTVPFDGVASDTIRPWDREWSVYIESPSEGSFVCRPCRVIDLPRFGGSTRMFDVTLTASGAPTPRLWVIGDYFLESLLAEGQPGAVSLSVLVASATARDAARLVIGYGPGDQVPTAAVPYEVRVKAR